MQQQDNANDDQLPGLVRIPVQDDLCKMSHCRGTSIEEC